MPNIGRPFAMSRKVEIVDTNAEAGRLGGDSPQNHSAGPRSDFAKLEALPLLGHWVTVPAKRPRPNDTNAVRPTGEQQTHGDSKRPQPRGGTGLTARRGCTQGSAHAETTSAVHGQATACKESLDAQPCLAQRPRPLQFFQWLAEQLAPPSPEPENAG